MSGKARFFRWMLMMIFALVTPLTPGSAAALAPEATTYYVSSSLGNDGNNGLSEGSPFASISKVNSLALQPGDRVLLRCGDVWRANPLVITRSGSSGQPITFSSYPSGCANQPTLLGTQTISGWSAYSGNIYQANLSAGANAGKFSNGVNQLFRGGQRLTLGRWPNLDAADGGYSTIETQPSGSQFTDNELPAGNWNGAIAHIRGMVWYLINRQVTGVSGKTVSVGAALECWDSNCSGWGYFLNNHLNTLDQEGEWFYDAATQRVYLYTTGGAPANGQVEGSVVLQTDDRSWGAVQLGTDLAESIAYVTIENLAIRGWYRHGIAMPTNLHPTENHHLILTRNTITDVDGIGIYLTTWVWGASDGRPDGLRGGYNNTVSSNTIERANKMGISASSRNSTFSDNLIRDVARLAYLGARGMGCDYDDNSGACTGDGAGINLVVGQPNDSAHSNTFMDNRLERTGYSGFLLSGHDNTFRHNVVREACISKGDCGAFHTFGGNNFSETSVYNLLFEGNVIVDPVGNPNGNRSDFDWIFAFGIYIDHYSRDITVTGNSVINASASGILFQDSTGSITDNTLYNSGHAFNHAAQVWVKGTPASVSNHRRNILYTLNPYAWTLMVDNAGQLGASDQNYFFHPYREAHVRAAIDRTLANWRTYSGKDASSKEGWFSLPRDTPTNSRAFVNDTAQSKVFDLAGRLYVDVNQSPYAGSLTLPPYSAKILIDQGPVQLALTSLNPFIRDVDEAASFTLTVYGTGFTGNSVVRWNGAARSTTFVSAGELQAAISAGDVDNIGTFPVTVYDPSYPQGQTETQPRYFSVSKNVYGVRLPMVMK